MMPDPIPIYHDKNNIEKQIELLMNRKAT